MKGIKQAFDRITTKVVNSQRGCVQCDNNDCSNCKHRNEFIDENPVEPKPMCMHFALIQDTGCTGFMTGTCDWSIDDGIHGSFPYYSDWSQYMINFYPNGGGGSFSYVNCFGLPSTFVLRTFTTSPISPITSIDVIDGNCNLGRSAFTTLCNKHCFEVEFGFNPAICTNIYIEILEFGTILLLGDPVGDPVGFNGILENNLQQIYGTGVSSTTNYDAITGLVTIQMFNIYTDFAPTMNYNCGLPTQIPFNEITC